MLSQNSGKQLSFYYTLYDRIPEDHLLKKIDTAVDFSFINELLVDSYSRTLGRPAKEPELMMKLLFLEFLYNLSDQRVLEEANCNLAYLWFLGLNPEDALPHPSLLAKFRTQRLKDITLDEVISEIIHQAIEKKVIKPDAVAIDATHIQANCKKQVPERIMKHLAKKIFRDLEQDCGKIPEEIDTDIPDYTQIEDHKEAKKTMKEFLEKTIETAEAFAGENTTETIEEAKDVLSDEKFILQKGLRSLCDKDARVGNKSKTQQFFGYKAEIMMTNDGHLITAVNVDSGETMDGHHFEEMLERTCTSGVEVKELYGDKAYCRKNILDSLKKRQIEGYIPVSASVYKIDESYFSYNKDSDQWFCRMGNSTTKCKKSIRKKQGKPYEYLSYYFEKEPCKECPHRKECFGKSKRKTRILEVSVSTSDYYELSQKEKTPEFKEKYKNRAAIECKNAEMKRFYGMSRARGWGLRGVITQVKLTAIAVNLRAIARLV